MDLISNAWNLIVICLIWVIGLFISVRACSIFMVGWRRAVFLYLWHTIFCVIYANYVVIFGGDSIDYFDVSVGESVDFSFGTMAVVAFTRLFSYYFNFSLLSVFLIYNIIGFVGLLAFDGSLQYVSRDKKKFVRVLAGLLVFLPSVSFWSSAIGKDAFSFMAIGLALWAAADFNRRVRLMILAILIMFLVRPHMSGLMVIAMTVSLLLRGNISVAKKSILCGLFVVAFSAVVPFAMDYAGLSSFNDFDEYVEQRQGYNQDGGGGIDISGMSLPMQLFTYLFRPLPFEAHTIFAFAASFDNVFLIIVFVFGVSGYIKYRKHYKNYITENISFMWIYSLSAWLILAITTANLGISVRQKWMFVPILAFLLISMMGKRTPYGHDRKYGLRSAAPSSHS